MKNKQVQIIFSLMTFVFLAWIAVILLYVNLWSSERFTVWPGIIAGIVAFVVSTLSLFLENPRYSRSTTEIRALPVWFTVAYFGAAMALNTSFVLWGGLLEPVFVIGNLVLLVVFAAARFFISSYITGATRKIETAAQKIGKVRMISTQLGVLLQYAEDAEVRQALRTLKERVDLGNNVGYNGSEILEEKLLARLYTVQDMMNQGADKQLVLAQIAESSKLWNERAARMA